MNGGEVRVGGRLVANLMGFSRLLRAAGMPIGPGRVIEAIRAVQAVGVTQRRDFYWALHSVFVHRADQRALFDHAFRRYWKEPAVRDAAIEALASASRITEPRSPPAGSRRMDEELSGKFAVRRPDRKEAQVELERVGYSPKELKRRKDFEQMSGDEIEEAKRAVERMRLPVKEQPTRRFEPRSSTGRLDMRRTLNASVRSGGLGIPLRWKRPRRRPLPLVALCDISGSMGRYTRMFLRFLHALTRHEARVETFLFGTRLSHVTRHIRARDADEALASLGEAVEDWSGGTRIGECLRDFNRRWSRRVLAQGAVVLLMTDGLDRDEGRGVEREMDRLHRSCRRLIWLNPLLRYEAFEPKALGVRAILPYVDDFRPVHSLESLDDLVRAISAPSSPFVRRSLESTSGGLSRSAGAA